VIDAELGRKDHGSIPATAIGRRLEPLDVRTERIKKIIVFNFSLPLI
jgi:hypothetical protein